MPKRIKTGIKSSNGFSLLYLRSFQTARKRSDRSSLVFKYIYGEYCTGLAIR